jgi:nucleoid DNA-binding protein
LSTLPGRNFGCELALIWIGSPVRGLRPVDALRRVTEKLPKPTNRTSSPRFKVEVITSALKRGDEVRLVGFGNFSVTRRKASTGRNPRTGEPMQIKASSQPKFRPGKILKDAVQ